MSTAQHCGYTEINLNCVIISYNDIIHLHDYVVENWEHPRGYFKGPQLKRILEKDLQSFPCLVFFDVDSTLEFYNAFHKTLFLYLLLVMPFDCISIKMGYKVLYLPGLDLPRYAMISWVLMELLTWLLPRADAQVNVLVNMVCIDSAVPSREACRHRGQSHPQLVVCTVNQPSHSSDADRG